MKVSSSKKHVAVHPPFKKMVEEAIIALNERNGSSRQVVKKYVLANYTVKNDAATISNINAAIRKGVDEGVFAQPKGPSGPIKLVTSSRLSSVASKKKASSIKNVKSSATSTKAAAVSENTPVVIQVDTSESVAGKKSATQPRSTKSTKTRKLTPFEAAIAKFAMPEVPFEVTFAKYTKSQPRPAAPIPPPSFGPSGTLFDCYRLGRDEEAAASVASSSMKPPVARVKRRVSEDDDLVSATSGARVLSWYYVSGVSFLLSVAGDGRAGLAKLLSSRLQLPHQIKGEDHLE
ncbi:hypothetical protein SeLEV6574_g06889 [Synchytrium endobioticum]|uniref:Histone H1 n=1 Tax=Synchytrium endobioticum TaxID=286115 RepID=A0A507CM03_9FUNG|nr:hypothetical protein SeLEV6574_g06889 [Synchytrium endobioticum]